MSHSTVFQINLVCYLGFQDDVAGDDNNYEHLVQWWCTIGKEITDRLHCYIIANNIDLLMLYLDLESIECLCLKNENQNVLPILNIINIG